MPAPYEHLLKYNEYPPVAPILAAWAAAQPGEWTLMDAEEGCGLKKTACSRILGRFVQKGVVTRRKVEREYTMRNHWNDRYSTIRREVWLYQWVEGK